MTRRLRGASIVEYLVLVVLLVALIGGALLAVAGSMSNVINNTYNQLGS